MKKIVTLCAAALIFSSSVFAQKVPATGGWADTAKLSYGKENGKIVIDDSSYPDPIAKKKAFVNALAGGKSLVILSGDVDLSEGIISDTDHSYFDEFSESSHKRLHEDIIFPVSGNKTIIGTNNARIMFGGLVIKDGASNIIIRNITFYDAHGSTEYDTKVEQHSSKKASIDALVIEYNEGGSISNGIWIDHCTFTDGTCEDLVRNYNHDGQFDIKAGKGITVSYCEFTNHDKVMLVAPSDKFTTSADRQITLHHNYFHNTVQRTPRSRGCQMHIYNNYYDDIGVKGNLGFCFGPGIGSKYIIENNYIGKTHGTVLKYSDPSKAKAATLSKIYQSGNNIKIDDSNTDYDKVDANKRLDIHLSDAPVFKIPYEYALEDASKLKETIPLVAGANKVKIEVNGVEY